MTNVVLKDTPLIRRVGEMTGRSIDQELFDTAQTSDFNIGRGAISSRNLQLKSKGVLLDFRGDYYFSRRIEGMIRVGYLQTVLGEVPLPLVRDLAGFVDKVAGKLLLAFRVSGSASNPRIEPIMLPLFQGMDTLGER
jgi:hypothetical protein